jgi:hypothetical protein
MEMASGLLRIGSLIIATEKGGRIVRVPLPAGARDFSPHHNVKIASAAHPASSISNMHWGLFPWREIDRGKVLHYLSTWRILHLPHSDRLCGLVVKVPGYRTEMYCVSCEIRPEFIYVMEKKVDRLCGLVVRVPGYRSTGPDSIPGATRFSEK